MDLEIILNNIKRHIDLDSADVKYLKSSLTDLHVKRSDFIQKQGAPCKYIYFVNSGLLRAFYLSPKGKDTTVMFAKTDWWITDMHCFINELPAMVNIQAVEASTLLKLSKRTLDEIYQNIPKFNSYFRVLVQNAYCREQLRTIQNLSLSAKERYNQFLSKYPEIAHNITLKQTASYLGITPEFLSAIRAEKD